MSEPYRKTRKYHTEAERRRANAERQRAFQARRKAREEAPLFPGTHEAKTTDWAALCDLHGEDEMAGIMQKRLAILSEDPNTRVSDLTLLANWLIEYQHRNRPTGVNPPQGRERYGAPRPPDDRDRVTGHEAQAQ